MKKTLLFLVIAGFANAQAPSGYYNSANGLTGASLKTALSNIITNGHQDKGYNGLWTGYKTTDIDKNYENDGSILDIYSERPAATDPYKFTPVTNQCGTYSVEGNCYNREHIIPQSLFSEAAPMVSDIHFIRATDGKVNGMRSNYPFGKVGTATFTSLNGSKLGNSVSSGYSGTVFEPIDEFKGDVARMIFYFVTRYQNKLSTFTSGNILGSTAFPGLQTWELNVLLAWHSQDPVSQAEINRNNASYTFQGNRNPFIDNPDYVNLVWGSGSGGTNPPTNPPTNCINETFETIPTSSPSIYSTRTWTNSGITWTATDARTDQTISTKAITVRSGSLTSSSSANGIGSLTVTSQLKFSGSNGTFNVKVNGVTVGTIPYNTNVTTTTISNINISGNVVVTLENTDTTGNRVALDNLSWTCYSTSAKQITSQNVSSEIKAEAQDLHIYPNPIVNQEIFVKGNTENIKKAEIYSLQGKVLQTIDNPFKNSRNSIRIKNLEQGIYILKLDNSTLKFIVK